MNVDFPGRLLAIDHGTKFIGLATCDRIGLIASPLSVMKRKSRQEDFERLHTIIETEAVVAIVLGLPPRPPDFVGTSQSDIVRNWAKRFIKTIDIPLYFWDEGLSSADAEEQMRASGKRLPDRIDAHAAAVFLQSFLNAIREGQPWPEPFVPGISGDHKISP